MKPLSEQIRIELNLKLNLNSKIIEIIIEKIFMPKS